VRYVAVVLMDELSCRCATFITNVLDSDNDAVSYVAHGVYLSRLVAMLSSVACDTVFCLKNIASIKKVFVGECVRYAQSPVY